MKDLAALLLIVALGGLAAIGFAENRADPAPAVHAAWQQPTQPDNRLFAPCPIGLRNLPHENLRNA